MKHFKFLTMLLISATLAFIDCGISGDEGSGGGEGGGGDTVINISLIEGVTPPAYNEFQVTTITETDQYTGIVSWSPNDNPFGSATVYMATITLTAKSGYTLTGVAADFFTVSGATSDTNNADSGVVTAEFPVTAAHATGYTETYTADGVSFVMTYVSGGLTFPTGLNDEGTATITNDYWIGETELTYELWQKVYTWATSGSGATGAGQYNFSNAGTQGDNGSRGVQHPVTGISWRDSVVWCNAFTEWYNVQKNTSYECVYTYNGNIIRTSRAINGSVLVESAVASTTAKGFRLLTSNEWECAARYRNGTQWTFGDHVSGDDSGACYNDGSILGGLGMSTVFGNYAVYDGNSVSSTAAVKSKAANALGLYDMSGNVWEWCFTTAAARVYRSGSWYRASNDLRVGYWGGINSGYASNHCGLRFARTQ